MILQRPQEALCLREIFQNVHLRFLGIIDHLQIYLAAMEDSETTTPKVSTSQDQLKQSFLYGIGEIAMSISWRH